MFPSRLGAWTVLLAAFLLAGCQSAPTKNANGSTPQPSAPVHLDPKADAVEATKQLTKAGFGPKKPAGIAFYLYFKDKSKAENAAKDMKADGYRTDVHQVDPTGEWTCTASRQLAPGTPEFTAAFVHAAEVAIRNGGEYDGWEAALD